MKIKNLMFTFVAFALALPARVFAADATQEGLNKIKGAYPSGGRLMAAKDFPTFAAAIINLMLYFSGIIAVLFIVLGGYWYITAGGNDEQAEKGRKSLTNAVIGLVIIGLSWVIVNVVIGTLNGSGGFLGIF